MKCQIVTLEQENALLSSQVNFLKDFKIPVKRQKSKVSIKKGDEELALSIIK